MQPTLRKVSEKPSNKTPGSEIICGALRYTFTLTDVAVNLLLGTKYQLDHAFLHSGNGKAYTKMISPPLPAKVQVPVSQRMLEKYGKDITLCPKCNKGKLVWICTTYPTTNKLIFSKSRNGTKQNAAFLKKPLPEVEKRYQDSKGWFLLPGR